MSDNSLRILRGAEAGGRMRDPFRGSDVWSVDSVVAGIEKAFRSLGNTSDMVASRLTAMHCAGERSNPRGCPVIAYLKRQRIGNFDIQMLSGGRLEIQARDGWTECIKIPPAVRWFTERFDRGEFPECAAPGSSPGTHAGQLPDWEALQALEALTNPEVED